jgi:hypothetical protein
MAPIFNSESNFKRVFSKQEVNYLRDLKVQILTGRETSSPSEYIDLVVTICSVVGGGLGGDAGWLQRCSETFTATWRVHGVTKSRLLSASSLP